ncbi:MAG: type VI secretion system-associated FHA domain protein TagH [Pseudomonadota bacterium]
MRLQVISDHRQLLGERSNIVFGVGGGSIGRASDNDWVLPDPLRYLSGHHARVHFRQGAFYLEDTSTNGVYANGAVTPLSRGGAYALKNGDVLRFGDYQVEVNIDVTETIGTGTAASLAIDRVVPLRAHNRATQDDLGASLNFEALIHADGVAAAMAAASEHAAIRADDQAQQRLNRLRAAARARLEGPSPALYDVRSGLQAFCRGAGIDPEVLPPDSDTRMLHLAGRMLREVLLGLQDLNRSQHAFHNRHRIEMPAEEAEGPTPDGAGVDDYLRQLLVGHDKRELDAVMLLRAAFKQAGRHDAALAPALGAAFAEFMAHLDPESIESRVKTGGPRGASRSSGWELYGEIYRNLMAVPEGQLPHLFVESLAQAYLKALKDPDTE